MVAVGVAVADNQPVKKESLLKAGKFIPELKWFCDWFANYVAGFREGICFVPEALTVFNTHPASYSKSGRSKKGMNREVLRHMLALLDGDDYANAAAPIRQSGALYLFGKPMLQVMLCRPRFWHFLTPVFLRKTLTLMARSELKKWRRSATKRLGKRLPPPKHSPL